MYMRPAATESEHAGLAVDRSTRFAVGLAAVIVLALFLYPSPVLDAAQQSVASLFPSPGSFFGLNQ